MSVMPFQCTVISQVRSRLFMLPTFATFCFCHHSWLTVETIYSALLTLMFLPTLVVLYLSLV